MVVFAGGNFDFGWAEGPLQMLMISIHWSYGRTSKRISFNLLSGICAT